MLFNTNTTDTTETNTPAQRAALIVRRFQTMHGDNIDNNQAIFDRIINSALECAPMREALEKLFADQQFDMTRITKELNEVCIIDVYLRTEFDEYEDIVVVDNMICELLPASRLMSRLLDEAYDQAIDDGLFN
jgi:hypothetical protein